MRKRSTLIKKYAISNTQLEDIAIEMIENKFENYSYDLANTTTKVKFGQIIHGGILSFDQNYLYVNIGQKSDGYLDISELSTSELKEIKKGDIISVLVDDFDYKTGMVVLSRKKAERIENWNRINENYAEGRDIEGTVIRQLSNGLLVDIGVIAFLPISQISDKRIEDDLSFYIGQRYEFEILKIDQEKQNIILSRKKLIERNKKAMRKALLEHFNEGDICEGIVKNITNYGAFIDLGGVDGLLHITDISWNRINSPKDILTYNQKIKVKILKIDKEKERVSLGLKQLIPNPWKEIERRYKIGTKLQATILDVSDKELSIQLDVGVETYVNIDNQSTEFKIGEKVDVQVDKINIKNKKIDLLLI